MTMRLLHACGLTWCAGQRLPHWSALSAALAVQADLLGLQGSTSISSTNDAAALTLAAPNLHPIHAYVNSDAARLPTTALSELTLQAASGMMSVHGRSSGKANPLGVEYLAVLTAAMTLQATLAAVVGQLRGGVFHEVYVSPLACGLLSIGQYLAGATAPEDPEQFLPGQYSPILRPPFVSSDGVVFELETLDSNPWRLFWDAVGVPAALAGQAWKAFLLRYAKAVSPMPDECMTCLSRLPFARIQELAQQARLAFAKIGVLMASAHRTPQALHPTNLHVNKEMFPNDTVQSKVPSPGWLENWLNHQIHFDKDWEHKVSSRILHNLSLLMNHSFKTVQDLNRYRKSLIRPGAGDAGGLALA